MSDDMREQLVQVNKEIGGGIIGALATLIFGLITYSQLTDLETGKLQSVRVWSPVALMYNMMGFGGAVSVFFVGTLFFAYVAFSGWKERNKIVSQIGRGRYKKICSEERQKVPKFMRSTDDEGRYPKSTIVLAVILISLFIAAFVGVKLGLIH